MENRFFDEKQKCRRLWGLIPEYCEASPNTAQDLERLLEIYQEDIGPRAAVVPEVQRWENKWKNEDVSTVPSSAIEALCARHADIYPNVYILLTILGILLVSTATSERSFSNTRRLKTYLRSSIGNVRITALALPSIHKDRQIDREKIMNDLLPAAIADLISSFSIHKICERDRFTKATDLKRILYDKQLLCPWRYRQDQHL